MTEATDVLRLLDRFYDRGEACALVTVVRCIPPTSAKPGEKAVVTGDGVIHGWIGGGCAQPAVVRTVREVLAEGRPRLIRVAPKDSGEQGVAGIIDFNMACASGGTLDLFVEPVLAAPVVRVHGGAPTARHVAGLAAWMGFEVHVLAPGTEPQDYPQAARHTGSHAVPDDWPHARWSVIATQGQGDRAALETELRGTAEAIALIASRRKRDKLLADFADRGGAAQRLACVHAPAGVDIAARTPEEIALAVTAQLIQWRRGESAVKGSASRPPGAVSAGGCCGETGA